MPNSFRLLLVRLALVVLAVVVAAAFARLCWWTGTEQVSFDGAMNLEVARSLAEGHGYNRLYAGHSGFAHEIQSRAPLILPAAAVFATFGVGIWQSQLTNLLYVIALAIVVFLIVRRLASWEWGLLAVAVCLWTPGIREVAMNGYGEVPALVWWLAAMFVLCRDEGAPSASSLFVAGTLAGLAVLTKTVLAIGLVAMLPVLVALLVARRVPLRAIVGSLLAFVVGLALPALLYEIAHVVALGDVGRWRTWLNDEVRAIHMQAGTAQGFHDTHGIGTKLRVHTGLLADSIGLPPALLPVWLLAPIALAACGRRWLSSSTARAVVLGLVVFAAIYVIWWLGFTPTEKAWYRRIFNGVLALEIVLVVMVAALWKRCATLSPRARGAAGLAFILLAAMQIPLAWSDIDTDDTADFASSAQLADDLARLDAIPANEEVYGVGWYSAPVLALYSGRRFDNIATMTPAELAAVSPIYLVLDLQTLKIGAAQYWLDRYRHREIARSDHLGLVEIDANVPQNPFATIAVDEHLVTSRVDFHAGEYPYLFGFQNREGDGWRWAMTDAELLLRYGGEPELDVDIYLPALRGYRFKRDVGITVWAGACRLGAFRQDESRRERWWLPATQCGLQPGQLVAVRLVSDNLYESRDDRQLGYIVHALGFADPATAQR